MKIQTPPVPFRQILIGLQAVGCLASMVICPAVLSHADVAEPATDRLTPEVATQLREAEEKHRLLFELAERHDARFAQNININDKVLNEIHAAAQISPVDGGTRIELPAAFCRVHDFFSKLWVHGDRMENTRSVTFVQGGESTLVKYSRYGNGLLLKYTHLTINPQQPAHLIVEGDTQPTLLRWVTPGIASRFDPSPFLGFGEDRPAVRMPVTVSTRHWRSIGGVSELDRTRYFRIYSQPNNERYPYHRSELEALGFQQGRQMFKFNPALERGYGEHDQPLLGEDLERPGYADPAFFEVYHDSSYAGLPENFRFVMCFDNWPSFMEVQVPNVQNKRGTPRDFDAAAELAARFLNNQIEGSGRTATWWEVKNESDIQYEWTYHGDPNADPWGLLIDFHNKVAQAIHDRVDPAIKVGGPTAAWPAFHVRGFDHWRNYARFKDGTADDLDFYSYHFYFPPVYNSIDPHGYLDARLDMIQSHMHTTGNVKPLVISEFGAIGKPTAGTPDGRQWTNSKGFSSQWMRYLERPDEFDIVVPFMLGFVHWNPLSKGGVWAKDEEGNFYRTANYHVMELWSEFQGRRVPAASDNPRFHQHAVLDGDMLYVALNNETDERKLVDLQLDTDVDVASARQKRFYFANGDLRYEVDAAPDLRAIPVNVAETTIVAIQLDGQPRTTGVLAEHSYYGGGTAIPNQGEPIGFDIRVTDGLRRPIERAELRLGMHREDSKGLGDSVEVTINGVTVKHSLARFGKEGYFGYARIPLPSNAIQEQNKIAVRFAEPGGTLAAARLTVTSHAEH